MFIELDFNSNEAIYMQLRNQIILGIAQDKIKNGESLPSVRQLAEDIGVNMHTVNKAYALLRNDGYLKLDRRKGAVVCVTVESRKEQLEKVNLDMQMLVAEAIRYSRLGELRSHGSESEDQSGETPDCIGAQN